MSRLNSWLPRRFRPSKSTPFRRNRLALTRLEAREVPALFTVTSTANSGANTLRQAVIDANANGTGLDTIDFNLPASSTITLASEIAITGSLIIDGSASDFTISGNNATRIFNIGNATASLDVTLFDLNMTKGKVTGDGGTIRNDGENLTIQSCFVSNSTASGLGGGVFSTGPLTIANSSLSGDSAAGGGAIAVYNGSLNLTSTQVSFNKATDAGGGVWLFTAGNNTIDGGSLQFNSAKDGAHIASGIYAGKLDITNSTLSDGTASNRGGALSHFTFGPGSGGAITVAGSSVTGNTGSKGGGFYFGGPATGASFTIRNTTIVGNSCTGDGGGIRQITSAPLLLQNCTVTGNTALAAGGGLYHFGPGSISLESTILSNNKSTFGGDARATTATFNYKNSAVGNTTGIIFPNDQGGNLAPGTDLKLGALSFGHVRPNNDSPVIDKGSNPAGLTTDARGLSRVWGNFPDIGAVEAATFINVLNANDSGPGSLRHFIDESNADNGGASGAASTIGFDPTFFATAQTITVDLGAMFIDDAVSINGPDFDKLTLNANGKSRLFDTSFALDGTNITISDMTLTGGSATQGGAIFIGEENVFLPDVRITNSQANDGGAIFVNSQGASSPARLTLLRSIISGNAAVNDGGGIYFFDGGGFLFTDSLLVGNIAGNTGGGLYFYGAANAGGIKLKQTVIAGNSAGGGGGGINLLGNAGIGTLVVNNSTIIENTSDATGGGILRTAGGFTIALESSVVSGNTAPDNTDIFSAGTVTMKNSAVGSGNGFSKGDLGGNLAFQPHANLMLGPITITGAPTFNGLPQPGSPLVDAGSNPDGNSFDIRTIQRSIGQTDIGALEILNLVVLNANDAGSGSLRQTLAHANSIPGDNTVTFDKTVFATAQTITLASTLTISDAMTVTGPGARLVRVSGNNAVAVVNIDTPLSAQAITISGVTIADGKSNVNAAFFNNDEAVTFRDCTFTNHLATTSQSVGVVAAAPGSLLLEGCSVTGNSTTGSFGAIGGSVGTTITVRNSTFSNNSAGQSGGAIFQNGSLVVQNSTLVGNSAGTDGGAIYVVGAASIESSIVSGNFTGGLGADIRGNTVSVKNSAIGSTSGFIIDNKGGNLLNQPHADLKLRPLANNGGPVDTFAPLFDSPLLNVGSNPASLTTDARGQTRDNGGVDMGAFELHTFVTSNQDNGGIGQIRAALADADRIAGPDTVSFSSLFDSFQFINLNGTELAVNSAVNIQSPVMVIDAGDLSRVFNTSGAPAGTAIVFNNMFLTECKADDGAVVFIGDESVTFNGCMLFNGEATDDGGAIAVNGNGTLSLNNSGVTGNTAGGSGGGIFLNAGATLSTLNSTIRDNSAGANGGGVYFFLGGSLTVVSSTISGNRALQTTGALGGGGIYFYGTATQFLIANSTISGNSAVRTTGGTFGYGGGILLNAFAGQNFIENTTITNNNAGLKGGGVAQAGGTARFRSVLVADNKILGAKAATADVMFFSATTVTLDHNLIGINDPATNATFGPNTQTGTLAVPIDAKLGPLQENGGPTLTHALLPGSPAINKGNNGDGLAVDQRGPGFARVAGGVADVGAFEVQSLPTASVKIDSGTGQRSMIRSLTITFNEPVVFTGAASAAITLQRLATSTNPTPSGFVALSFSPASGPATSFTITFNDPTFAPAVGLAKSLIDGQYQLVLNAAQIKSASSGYFLDGDGNGTGGDNQTTNFHRLFGDVRGTSTTDFSGNGFTDNVDLIAFRNANGSDSTMVNYDPALDVNGDGFIDNIDLIAFRARLGVTP